jgi:orotate phosphoribosyltransferase
MHLVPTQDEVVRILRETGALRTGHFLYPTGLHSDEYLQVPLAMRYYQHSRTLSVSLSRLLRANPEIRATVPELSIVAPAPAGLPVAFGVCEALRAKQVYWAEQEDNEPLHFRQYLEQCPNEPVVLVDDILRSGNKLSQMKALLESRGAKVLDWRLSSTSRHPKHTTSDRFLSITSPSWTPCTTPTRPTALCAGREFRSRPCGYRRKSPLPSPIGIHKVMK